MTGHLLLKRESKEQRLDIGGQLEEGLASSFQVEILASNGGTWRIELAPCSMIIASCISLPCFAALSRFRVIRSVSVAAAFRAALFIRSNELGQSSFPRRDIWCRIRVALLQASLRLLESKLS